MIRFSIINIGSRLTLSPENRGGSKNRIYILIIPFFFISLYLNIPFFLASSTCVTKLFWAEVWCVVLILCRIVVM